MMAAAMDDYDLRRSALSAMVVIGIHAALALTLTRWHEPLAGDEGTEAIIVDLAPFTGPRRKTRPTLRQAQSSSNQRQSPKHKSLSPRNPARENRTTTALAGRGLQLPIEPSKPPDKQIEQPSPPALQHPRHGQRPPPRRSHPGIARSPSRSTPQRLSGGGASQT